MNPTRELITELTALASANSERLLAFLGRYGHLVSGYSLDNALDQAVDQIAVDLTGDSAVRATRAAQQVRMLVCSPTLDWWQTPLGRAVARADGYSEPVVPRSHAAAMLGVSRQRVYQLEQAGALDSTSAGIDNGSLIRALNTR